MSSIPSEIPPSYQSDFAYILSELSPTGSMYQSFAAITGACAGYLNGTISGSDFLSIIGQGQNQTTIAALSLTVSQLQDAVNKMATFIANAQAPSGAPFSSAPPLPWLTPAQIQELQNGTYKWPPQSLLDAFRNYTDLAGQLLTQTSQLVSDVSTDAIYGHNSSAIQADLTALQTLTTKWTTQKAQLDADMSDYLDTLATTDPLRVLFTQMQAYISGAIQPLVATAIANSKAAYTAAQTADQASQEQFMAQLPAGWQSQLQTIQSSLQLQQSQLQATLSQVQATYQTQVGGVNAGQPALVPTSASMSMMQLFDILAKTQLMIKELAQLFSAIDTGLSDARMRMGIFNLQSSSLSTNAFMLALAQAVATYNQTVYSKNVTIYTNYQSNYQAFANNLGVINQVIDAANKVIADQNARASLIASGSTLIDQDSVDSINSLSAYDTLVAQLFQSNPTYTAETYPPPIGTATIPLFKDVTAADFPPLPSFSSTQSELDAFNQAIVSLVGNIGPLLPDIISSLASNGVTIDPSFSTFPELYLDQVLPINVPGMSNSLYTVLNGSLAGFLLQLYLQQHGATIPAALVEVLLNVFPELRNIPGGSEALSNPKTGLPVVMGLSIADILNPKSDVGRALNLIMESGALQEVISHMLERGAILAGLNVAGTTPAWIKNLGARGVSLSAAIEEFIASGGKGTEEETTRASSLAFAEQLALQASDDKSLRQSAVTLISSTPSLAGLPEASIQSLISVLAVVQKAYLLSIATAAAIQGGMAPAEVLSAIRGQPVSAEEIAKEEQVGGRDELEATLNALGLPDTVRSVVKALIVATRQATSMKEETPPTGTLVEAPAAPPPPPPQPTLEPLVTAFQSIPQPQQQTILELPAVKQLQAQGIPAETAAAVIVGARVGLITPQMGASLLGLSLSSTETGIIHRLTTPTPEELTRREEERLAERKKDETKLPYTHPPAVPKSLQTQLTEGYQQLYRSTSEEKFAKQTFENFAQTVKRLSDFNTVALNTLMDPAKTIIKQFSFLTRTQQDPRQQPPILFTG